MNKKSFVSLALAAIMVCSLLTGCMGGKTVMKIGGNSISEEIYSAAISYADVVMFQQSYGFSMADMLDQELSEGKTGADMLKEQADGLIKEFESMVLFAKENGVKLGKEEKDAIKENKKKQIESAGGKKAFLEGLAESGANEALFDYIVERQAIYMKVYEDLFAGEGKFAPTAEQVAENMTGYARVKHVLIQANEGDADYAEKKAQAEKIAERAKSGEDFEALISEIAETGDGDPGMQSNPNGYIIDKDGYTADGSGQMVIEFTDASHALAENAVSGVVTSDFGFHIIKRYPFGAEYIKENHEQYAGYVAINLFAEEVAKFMQDVEVEYTKAYDEIDVHGILGVEKTLGAGSSSAEHSEDDGHDHGTDTEGESDDTAEGGIESGEAVTQE